MLYRHIPKCVSLCNTLGTVKQIRGVWCDRGGEIIGWGFFFVLQRKKILRYPILLRRIKINLRAIEQHSIAKNTIKCSYCIYNTYTINDCFFVHHCYCKPCPVSCLAGWQPCGRSPSLYLTPCSRTEPEAPPKEAHWPTESHMGDIEGNDWVTSTFVNAVLLKHIGNFFSSFAQTSE